jgi:hypothetical protein
LNVKDFFSISFKYSKAWLTYALLAAPPPNRRWKHDTSPAEAAGGSTVP